MFANPHTLQKFSDFTHIRICAPNKYKTIVTTTHLCHQTFFSRKSLLKQTNILHTRTQLCTVDVTVDDDDDGNDDDDNGNDDKW